jgi:hypothetical protein
MLTSSELMAIANIGVILLAMDSLIVFDAADGTLKGLKLKDG